MKPSIKLIDACYSLGIIRPFELCCYHLGLSGGPMLLRVLLLALLCVVGLYGPAAGQRLSSDRFVTPDQRRDLVEANLEGGAGTSAKRDVFLLLPIVPLTFTSLQKDDEGEWHLGAAMTAGIGASFLLGKAEVGADQRASIFPWIIFGGAINAGIRENPNDLVEQALSLSGFFGFNDIAISFARNLLEEETSFGISLKIDALTDLAPDAFMCFMGCVSQNAQTSRD